MSWFLDNLDLVGELFWRHAWISVVSIAIGFVVSLPIGWYANAHPRIRGGAIAAIGVLYTIPSLAVFVLLPPILGTGFLSVANVLVALSTYAAAIMVRTTADAFGSVSGEVLDAASAAGYSPAQRVFRVELPLAGPVLLAGLRVVSVSNVSILTVATLIGVSNLGSLFADGFRRDFQTEIVVGILATVVLALLLDLLLVLGGRLLMPWATARSAGAKVASA